MAALLASLKLAFNKAPAALSCVSVSAALRSATSGPKPPACAIAASLAALPKAKLRKAPAESALAAA
eukprot:CAMPEP_0176132636 /NCGR_PEP_ID=MMETSP0120_2-20121206/67197_1 /TAXON_ID=160619 /ORGANISM="Kryptoperidinium foliaceum, Strain CCMP 1326" /LENGTH=66 /DNA_ID=CAMNT_0017468127 /DNA_START=8 /DNA_END=204 /DNA_ORIENTATION=+